MDTTKRIESKRLKLGFSENQIAETIGKSLDLYCDIEWDADELCKAVELRRIKQLSQILGLEPFELFASQCPFSNDGTAYLEE